MSDGDDQNTPANSPGVFDLRARRAAPAQPPRGATPISLESALAELPSDPRLRTGRPSTEVMSPLGASDGDPRLRGSSPAGAVDDPRLRGSSPAGAVDDPRLRGLSPSPTLVASAADAVVGRPHPRNAEQDPRLSGHGAPTATSWMDDEAAAVAQDPRLRPPPLELELDRPAARARTGSNRSPRTTTAGVLHVGGRSRPGDPTTRGPQVDLAPLLGATVRLWLFALLVAAVTGGAASRQLAAALSGASGAAGLNATFALFGAHPGVLVYMLLCVVAGTAAAWFGERATRKAWAGGLIAALGGAALLAPWGARHWLQAFELVGTPMMDRGLALLAVPNVSDIPWAAPLAIGAGYAAGRREDSLLAFGAVALALFAAWRMDAGRAEAWAALAASVTRVAGDPTAAGDALSIGTLLIHARALADFALLLAPLTVVWEATRRGAGAAVVR
ncbi:MAG: hypothetical protein H6700_11560 [Myxococcales bacterium]|nr:hypothetical protein [Myxococcales bacterium]MCB9532395.1 hypothetical protein [Myxococcales bacterium]